MNYTKFFILFAIFFFSNLSGQSNFGLKFGPNISNFQNEEKGESGGYNSVAIFYDFNIYNDFLLSVELTWLRRHLYLVQLSSAGENAIPGDTFHARDYRWDVNGIGIPLLLKYNVNLHKLINIQPYIGYTWSKEVVAVYGGGEITPAGIVGVDQPDAIRKSDGSYSFVNSYLDIGISLKYKFMYLEFRYSHGFISDVSIEAFTDFYFDIDCFHILLGVAIPKFD